MLLSPRDLLLLPCGRRTSAAGVPVRRSACMQECTPTNTILPFATTQDAHHLHLRARHPDIQEKKEEKTARPPMPAWLGLVVITAFHRCGPEFVSSGSFPVG